MKKRIGRLLPQAREEGLITSELPDEVLVLDTGQNKAHCLNDFASNVWKRCDGKTTVKEMTLLLGRDFQKGITEEAVWLALDRLGKANLLTERLPLPGELSRLSRREAVRKFGLAAGVAVITSIVVPTEAMAGVSCTILTSCKHVCFPSNPPFPQIGKICKNPGNCSQICTTGATNCATWVSGQPHIGACVPK